MPDSWKTGGRGYSNGEKGNKNSGGWKEGWKNAKLFLITRAGMRKRGMPIKIKHVHIYAFK